MLSYTDTITDNKPDLTNVPIFMIITLLENFMRIPTRGVSSNISCIISTPATECHRMPPNAAPNVAEDRQTLPFTLLSGLNS
jgi:hypothetical protein